MEFNEAMFITKANNVFVKVMSSMMFNNLDDVRHFISDDLELKMEEKINLLKAKNQHQMFDELNVKNTNILKHYESDGYDVLEVNITSRYMDYILGDGGVLISGDNTRRIEVDYFLKFIKRTDAKNLGINRKCPSCGASMDISNSGKCIYCGNIFNQEDYDYVLVEFRRL